MIKKRKLIFYINVILKCILIGFFLIAIILNTPYLQSKGMIFRAPFFIGVTLILPIFGFVKKLKNYPHLADIFITLPFLLDTLGNIFGYFDSITIYDDILHALNWAFLILAYHFIRSEKIDNNKDAFLLGVGLGSILIILWELMEWILSVDGFGTLKGLQLSYNDTIGDLATSFLGGIIGSFIGTRWFYRNK